MHRRFPHYSTIVFASALLLGGGSAGSAVAVDSRASGTSELYQQSIKSTKKSLDREMIDVLYHDALDAYKQKRFDESLELLDKIYSLDPRYEDVAELRTKIRKSQTSHETEASMGTVRGYMRQGDAALRNGQTVMAISFWKQALATNPNYAPAKKKIQDANQMLAKREFESGYIHYHHNELEDALDSWSNAIALDPTYKQRGLLLLMSKVELQVRREQIGRLASQGFDQYNQGNLEAALQSYQELTKLEPRHEEARRYGAKIRIQLGQGAVKSANAALARGSYQEAIDSANKAIQYGFEVARAQQIKSRAEAALKPAPKPRVVKKPARKPEATEANASSASAEPPPPPAQPRDPEGALAHYRKGLAAVRAKDYKLAVQELDNAAQLDPTNERIYMARERARQEYANQGGAQ